MEKWVNGLRDAKEFWIQHHKRLEFTQKRSNGPHIVEPVTVCNEADNLVSIHRVNSLGRHRVFVKTFRGCNLWFVTRVILVHFRMSHIQLIGHYLTEVLIREEGLSNAIILISIKI